MKDQRPFISVVMPIYNVEKHLCQAVDSVLRQTFTDYEIILVDDCSPDCCSAICDEYAKKYDQVNVVHLEKNGGLSNARNQGKKYARGKYIFFMDSDDYIDDDLFEMIKTSIDKNPAKVVVFGLIEEYYDEKDKLKNTVRVHSEEMFYTNKKSVRKSLVGLEEKTMLGYAWNKFYDLDYLNTIGLEFENITLIEDIVFNIKFMRNVDTMNILDITPYHYNRRIDQSLTNKFVPEYFNLHYKRVRMLYTEYKRWGLLTAENEEIFANRLFRYILSALQRNCDPRAKMNVKIRCAWLNRLYKDEWICDLLSKVDYHSKAMNIIAYMVKKKRKIFVLLVGRMIYLVKNIFPILFSKVKQR